MLLAALALAFQATPAASAVVIPDQPALTGQIAARDAEFFALFFEGCDPARLRTMVAGDFEFYHDRGGFISRSGEEFVADYARNYAARTQPGGWRTRRELVAASLHVDPVPGHGAIEDGRHLFYERQVQPDGSDGPERLAGAARFTQLWVLAPDGWRLSRVFSFAHGAADRQSAGRE